MRISDWSSDVCSSDLTDASLKSLVSGVCAAVAAVALGQIAPAQAAGWPERPVQVIVPWSAGGGTDATGRIIEIGRASCRERVCQYVYISVVAVSLKKKKR